MAYVMADERGREFVYRLMQGYGIYKSVLRPARAPWVRPEERAVYNGAQQEVAQGLQAEAIACDGKGSLYLVMLSEAEAKRMKKEIEERKAEAEKLRKQKENQDDGSDGPGDDPGSDDNPSDTERGGG